MNPSGKVYLIGAGPGDLELLTLKAVRALCQADAILLDDLVNPEIARFLKPSAKIINVGKRASCKSTPQESIHQQMIELAQSGLCVARVKGGDPFIFGRGGEELSILKAQGIDVEVISGITSGMAAPAALGIPLTHRDFAHSVTFITGHNPDDGRINWRALVESRSTIVIYMGIATVDSILDLLLRFGLPPSTPCAVIENATIVGKQRHLLTTADKLSSEIHQAAITSPAILVIGAVVSLAQLLSYVPPQMVTSMIPEEVS